IDAYHMIDHAGIAFHPDEGEERYRTRYRYRGLPAHFPATGESAAVSAVSDACLLIDKFLFTQAGRFSADYLLKGREAEDLCLQLRANGHRNVYFAEATLMHLKRQSRRRHPE